MNLRTNISKRKALTKYELNKKERIEIIVSNPNLTNEFLSVKTRLNDTIKKYIDKMNDLLSKFNQDNEEIKKTMLELFGSLKTLSSKVKSDIYIE
ncbi:hypothetical protein [Mycoplasma sp. VS1572C]